MTSLGTQCLSGERELNRSSQTTEIRQGSKIPVCPSLVALSPKSCPPIWSKCNSAHLPDLCPAVT